MGLFSRFERSVENTVEGVADRISNAPVSPAVIAKKLEKKMHSERMVGSGRQYAPTLYTVLVNPNDDRVMMGMYPTFSGEMETMLRARANESGLTMDGQPLVRFIADNSLRSGKFDIIAETVAAPIVEQLRDDELQRYGITRGRYEAELSQQREFERQQAKDARREELLARSDRRAQKNGGRSRFGRNQDTRAEEEEEAFNRRFGLKGNYQEDEYLDEYNESYDEFYEDEPYFGSEPGADGKRRLPYVPEEEIDRSIDYGEYTFNSMNFDPEENQVEEEFTYQAAQVPAPMPAAPEAPAQAGFSAPQAEAAAASYQVPAPPAPRQAAAPAYEAPAAYQAPAAARPQAPSPAQAPARPQAAAPSPAPSAYRSPVSFTPASHIAPEAKAMPARAVPGVMDKKPEVGAPTRSYSSTPAAPPTMPYTSAARPAPRYRVRNLQNGRSFTLTGTRIYIGRETGCNIVVDDANTSRRHAELKAGGNGVWTITDLNSTNGTFVNGTPITSTTLADGDRITVGTTDLIFVVC